MDATPAQRAAVRFTQFMDAQVRKMERTTNRSKMFDGIGKGVRGINTLSKLAVTGGAAIGVIRGMGQAMEAFGRKGEMEAARVEAALGSIKVAGKSLAEFVGESLELSIVDLKSWFGGKSADEHYAEIAAKMERDRLGRSRVVLDRLRSETGVARRQSMFGDTVNKFADIDDRRRAALKDISGNKDLMGLEIKDAQRLINQRHFFEADKVAKESIEKWVTSQVDAFKQFADRNARNAKVAAKARAEKKERNVRDLRQIDDDLAEMEIDQLQAEGREREAAVRRVQMRRERALRQVDQSALAEATKQDRRLKLNAAFDDEHRRAERDADQKSMGVQGRPSAFLSSGIGAMRGVRMAAFGTSPQQRLSGDVKTIKDTLKNVEKKLGQPQVGRYA